MRIINPSVEIMRSGLEKEFITPEQFIERVGRTCYKSEDKITEDSAARFVGGLVKRGHEAMIEHWNLIFKTKYYWYEDFLKDWDTLLHSGYDSNRYILRPFLRFTHGEDSNGEERCIISGNMRAWRDYIKACVEGLERIPQYLHSVIKDYPIFFPEYQSYLPLSISNNILIPITESELVGNVEHGVHHNVTVKFICDRGVSHEIVRHRTASFAQESTRYCNYGLDKFGNEITVVEPTIFRLPISTVCQYNAWKRSCETAEEAYFEMIEDNCTPQSARSVLPNSLKTEVIMTGNLDCWDHFFSLRCAPDAHPDIQVVAKMVRDNFWTLFPERYVAVPNDI